MTRRLWWIVPAVVALAAAALLIARRDPPAPDASATAGRTAGSIAVPDDVAAAAGIETVAARYVERRDRVDASGAIAVDERRTARIGALVDGVVTSAPHQPGDRVGRLATLARIHSHVVHDAWAAYFKAIAERRRSETALAYARTAEARAARLVADKALSPQEAERASADRVGAEQALVQARAEVVRAAQELEHYGIEAREDADPREHEYVPVRTPIAGTVLERLVTEGAAVTPGAPLYVVSDLSTVWAIAEIDEALIARVAPGAPVTLHVAAYGAEAFTGTLAAVGDVVNPTTRRVAIRIVVPNPGGRLKPQMFARVAVESAAVRTVLVVPDRAVQTLEGETVVFVRTGEGQFRRRRIRVGQAIDGLVEVLDGLVEGETVATSGAFLLKSELAAPAEEP